jgi:excinuclease ABC subunit C
MRLRGACACVARVRESRARWLQLALQTAESNLAAQLSGRQSVAGAAAFPAGRTGAADGFPQRIECFDISHSSGEATVASCVVFDTAGAKKSDYRRFNIRDVAAGDDYAAMRQALARRFKRLQAEEAAAMPDILLIDGGKGQVSQALSVLEELQVKTVEVVGVAKGTTRKAGFETLILGDSGEERQLAADHPALHLIQQIRDEAHRFAITGHRTTAGEAAQAVGSSSPFPGSVPSAVASCYGTSAARRVSATPAFEELRKISGISANMAQTIYDHLHGVAD